tara:strand:- start:4366 stop:5241 length:876 start_codon:yes stop_codon:yes gene_type:complete
MIKPFEPDQVKTFRTPKYTGITLSLLSMFVLTAMFAVWNKVSDPSETHHSILVLAEKSLRAPLTEVSEQFKNELNVRIEYTFCNPNLIQNLEDNQSFDLIISSDNEIQNKDSDRSNFSNKIPIAEKKSTVSSVYCKLNDNSKSDPHALLFTRYLASQDKGQIYFKKYNLELKESDPWDLNPSITIYCEKEYQPYVLSSIDDFKKRNAVEVNLLFPDQEKLIANLIAISQSNSQNLLPDLLLVSQRTAKKVSPNYIPVYCKNSKQQLEYLMYFNTRFKFTCKRLVNYLDSKS